MHMLLREPLFDLMARVSMSAISILEQAPFNSSSHIRDTMTSQHGVGMYEASTMRLSVLTLDCCSGQAWGILGFAQSYAWTKDPAILQTATALSDHFLKRLSSATHRHPYVPLWDFDDNDPSLLRDTSAGMIAANGLLILHQQLATEKSPYLEAVGHIVKDTVNLSLATDLAPFIVDEASGKIDVAESSWASILKNATANNNESAIFRYSDHGLVYADYYFLELGNKLLRMGLV
jgi:hypothetical protein